MSAVQTQRYQEKREAILSAAALQFNQHGVKGATLAEIASSVGLVTNSVTYYYRKKEDLASACFQRSIDAFMQVATAAAAERHVTARIVAYCRGLARLFAAVDEGSHPPLVLFNDMRALPSPQFEAVSKAYTAMFRKVRDLLRSPETASLSRADLSTRAYALLSLGHWMRAWIARHEIVEYVDVADRVSDIVIRGSAPDPAAWTAASEQERSWTFRRDADPTAEAFLRAASHMVNEQGYRGASVDKISAMLNVTKGSFYHHNDNKEDLVWACFERSFDIIRTALTLADRDFGSGWERACASTRALARFQLSAEGPMLRHGAITALTDPARRAEVTRTMNRLTTRQTSVVIDGLIDGSVRPLDPTVAGHIGTGIISGAAGLGHWVQGVTEHNVAELYVRPMFTGILCPPAAR
ncbi:TetR/AcrR family transcriptional regulator [Rhizobacter sp. LjRoot28]|jgi:AcrR family transcriptional regulator|uniref:TetR/AcrR family transcriptional regulator n=1 Tax=Rhizobacter sp. LjRoot28 TaxID=3342309 RepID=UPI003ED04395